MAEYIVSAAKKMNSITEELLKLAKIRHIDTYEATIINMTEIVENAVNRINNATFSKGCQIKLPQKWPKLTGNAIWVEEVWYNLVSNACKYGGSIIELDWINEGAYLKFWVRDSGKGLSKEEQSQLFSKFSRIHDFDTKVKGHGLGLSIVQRIVEKQGGKIWVESKLEQGCTFFFTMPIANITHSPS